MSTRTWISPVSKEGPQAMPQNFDEWLPEFQENIVISTREHVDLLINVIDTYDAYEHEDLVL